MTKQEKDRLSARYLEEGFTSMAGLRERMGFSMKYETEENGKERYHSIRGVFRQAREAAEKMNFEENPAELADYMEALADCAVEIDEEAFDQYKELVNDFKRVLRRLADKSCPGRLLADAERFPASVRADLAAAIEKACGRGMILKEKYFCLVPALRAGLGSDEEREGEEA